MMAIESKSRAAAHLAGMMTITLLSLALAAAAWAAPDKSTKSASKKSADKSADKAADHDAHDDINEPDVDDDVTALVVPSEMLGKVKKIDRLTFAQELRALLIEGGADPTDEGATAKRHFDAARRLVPDDPRGAYAFGVVLLKHRRKKEALAQFEAAAKGAKGSFLPGIEAAAWVHALRDEYGPALAGLRDLARKIEQSDEWPTAPDREHSAEWLGRFVGYLNGPGKSPEHADAVTELTAEIDKLLRGPRKLAYEHGQKAAAARYDDLKAEAARPVDEVLAEARQKREELAARAVAADAEVKRIESEIREIKKPADKQIADINRDMRQNASKANQARRELEGAELAVEDLSEPRAYPKVTTYGRYRIPRITARAETAQEKKNREQALAQAKQNLDQLQTSYRQAKEEISSLKKQRDDLKVESRRAAAAKLDELNAAKHKSQEMSARAKDAAQMLTAEKVKARLTALESYVPLDPDAQRTRLLTSLKSHSSE